METTYYVKDSVIYEEGMIGSELYFVINGEVEVTVSGERLGFLGLAAFFGEPPMIELITGKGGNLLQVRARPHCRVV